MLGTVAFATCVVMLGFLWHAEGWRKGLTVLGLCFLTILILAVIGFLFKVDPAVTRYVAMTFWALWAFGLIVYNMAKGHIGSL